MLCHAFDWHVALVAQVESEDSEGNFAECPGRIWVSNKEKFCMGGIKSPSRGIEKADAAYGGDVSRLLDVCRESIIFETIEDMAACLQVGSFFDLAKLSSRPFSSLLSPCASDVEVCLATLFFFRRSRMTPRYRL